MGINAKKMKNEGQTETKQIQKIQKIESNMFLSLL
jgi:hypothetical protein